MERYRNKQSLWMAAAATAALVFGTAASATTVSYTSQAGALAPDDRPLGATADFTFDGACTSNCLLTLQLTNTEEMTGISQGLTDFHFTTAATGLTLTGADASQFADCSEPAKPDTPVCQFSDAPADAGSYDWTLTGTGAYTLAASPLAHYGIVNLSIDAPSDGVSNDTHNPWLVGPVDFFFTYSGALNISAVGFSFGTDQNHTTIPGDECDANCGDTSVPEPASLALLGIAALALAFLRRTQKGQPRHA